MPRQKQNLGIESPAFNFLQRKDTLGGVSSKSFESALRVGETQTKNEAERQIENSSKHLPVQRLWLGLQFRPQPARADRDVGAALDRFEQFLRLRHRRGKISVGKQANVAARVQHSIAHAVTFAAVAGILQQQNLGMQSAILAHDLRRIVARSVVDHENFRVPVLSPRIAENLIERRADAHAFVICGNDETVGHVGTGRARDCPCADYAASRRLSSIPKNSATNSPSQSPLRASLRMVTAACSWASAGLYGRAVRNAS